MYAVLWVLELCKSIVFISFMTKIISNNKASLLYKNKVRQVDFTSAASLLLALQQQSALYISFNDKLRGGHCEDSAQWDVWYLTQGIRCSFKDELKWLQTELPSFCLPLRGGSRSSTSDYSLSRSSEQRGEEEAKWLGAMMIFSYPLVGYALLIFLSKTKSADDPHYSL